MAMDTTTDRTLDAGALKALAHPLRVRIFDLLSERGPQTASSLAALVGETSGATSYHLRALAAHELIHEIEGRGTARERWWERRRGRIDLPSPDASMTPAKRASAQIVTSEFFRLRHETLMRHLTRRDEEVPDGWEDAGLVMTSYLHMTIEQVNELRAEMVALVDRAVERYRDQAGPGVRRVSLRAELFDLVVEDAALNRSARQQHPTEDGTP